MIKKNDSYASGRRSGQQTGCTDRKVAKPAVAFGGNIVS